MAQLIDVLANLVRKGFEKNVIGKSRDLSLLGLSFREAYEKVEARSHGADTFSTDRGDFGSEGGAKGEIIVFRVNHNGDKPSQWLVERCLPDGNPF